MSLATTCTHCGTCFRVVQDQLRVSEGWVRCGHCQQVFNALESLFDLDAPNEPIALPPSSATPARGVWQTEAAARWMRQHSRESTPGEREEPLSDDMLAALRADTAPAMLEADEAIDTSSGTDEAEEEGAENTAHVIQPITATVATEPSFAPAEAPPGDVKAVEAFGEAPAVEASEPAPLDDDTGTETTFAPLPIALDRHEPFFEATLYEPRSLQATVAPPDTSRASEASDAPLQQPSLPLTFDSDEATPAATDAGPASAAMFLSTADAMPAPHPTAEAADEAEPAPAPTPIATVDDEAALAPPDATVQEEAMPSFLADAAKRERWARPARWAFGVSAVLLTLSLVSQVAWHWRERLAMAWPVTQRPLAALCERAGCMLGAPRELNAVVVDNTALARPPGTSGYRLTVQLHNRATHPVATPNVDLTLTDAQGATVSRRVLAPTDFGYGDSQLPAQADLQWTAEFTLSEGNLVGYTVAAFYP